MSRYSDLLNILNNRGLLSSIDKLSEEDIVKVIAQYPEAPHDYFEYLRDIGYGELTNSNGYFFLFAGLIKPEEILRNEKISSKLDGILLFGDDLEGFYTGFSIKDNWGIVRIFDDLHTEKVEGTFENFIRQETLDFISENCRFAEY